MFCRCIDCKWCVYLKWKHRCVLANEWIPDAIEDMYCDFFRRDEGYKNDDLDGNDSA